MGIILFFVITIKKIPVIFLKAVDFKSYLGVSGRKGQGRNKQAGLWYPHLCFK